MVTHGRRYKATHRLSLVEQTHMYFFPVPTYRHRLSSLSVAVVVVQSLENWSRSLLFSLFPSLSIIEVAKLFSITPHHPSYIVLYAVRSSMYSATCGKCGCYRMLGKVETRIHLHSTRERI